MRQPRPATAATRQWPVETELLPASSPTANRLMAEAKTFWSALSHS
jgi:hypothetical protein